MLIFPFNRDEGAKISARRDVKVSRELFMSGHKNPQGSSPDQAHFATSPILPKSGWPTGESAEFDFYKMPEYSVSSVWVAETPNFPFSDFF
jgi:hypothetical protein